ncbi:MAG TPA: type II and III secretion system protein family protein [Longimicrobiales bacterium]
MSATNLEHRPAHRRPPRPLALFLAATIGLFAPGLLHAQQIITRPDRTVSVINGRSVLIIEPASLERVSVTNPAIAEAVVVSPREILINGKALGSTSLLLWDNRGARRLYTVEVTPDGETLERHLRRIFPDDPIDVTVSGGTIFLSGPVHTETVAERAIEIAKATGANVVSDLVAAGERQVLLQVRFAEVSRSALEEFDAELFIGDANDLDDLDDPDSDFESFSDGLVRLFLFDEDAELEVLVHALRTRGLFKVLAEPNLLALDGQEASFLAGGEFPFPVVQGGDVNAITIVWKEFGVRLRFVPEIQSNGAIRLAVAPEVSSLNFANGLTLNGFQVPSLVTRRAQTEVELRPGQHLAIAGLIDNSIRDNLSKIPILGDIPILGALFRSKDLRQERTELLVLVTPHLVEPSETPPPLPTGEPYLWNWDEWLRRFDIDPDTISRNPR